MWALGGRMRMNSHCYSSVYSTADLSARHVLSARRADKSALLQGTSPGIGSLAE